MMKYYVGYFNKHWDKSKFTVVAATPTKLSAVFIRDVYNTGSTKFEIITAAEAMTIDLVYTSDIG